MQAVFEVDKEKGLQLVEIAEGVSTEDVTAATGSAFEVPWIQWHLSVVVAMGTQYLLATIYRQVGCLKQVVYTGLAQLN